MGIREWPLIKALRSVPQVRDDFTSISNSPSPGSGMAVSCSSISPGLAKIAESNGLELYLPADDLAGECGSNEDRDVLEPKMRRDPGEEDKRDRQMYAQEPVKRKFLRPVSEMAEQ